MRILLPFFFSLLLLFCAAQRDSNIDESASSNSLVGASLGGHTERVRQLIAAASATSNKNKSPPVEFVDEYARKYYVSPLWAACQRGHRDTILALLELGANPNVVGQNEWTPLHLVVKWGYEDVVEALLKKGANPNVQQEDGWTPLMQAAGQKSEKIVQLLLDAKADLKKKRNVDGAQALHLAASAGSGSVIRQLIHAGAEVNAKDANDLTPLMRAVINGHLEASTTLLAIGKAVPDMVGGNPKDRGLRVSALYMAITANQLQTFALLLDHKANPNVTSYNAPSPIHAAVLNCSVPFVDLLLHHNADPNKLDPMGVRPLMMAVQQNSTDCARIALKLCQKGALTDKRDRRGLTPLLVATQMNHGAAADALLQGGADVNVRDEDGRTPLMHAAILLHFDMIHLLHDFQADFNAVDNDGNSVMHFAVLTEDIDAIRFTAAFQGTKINLRNTNGYTPKDLSLIVKKNETLNALLGAWSFKSGSDFFSPLYRSTGLTEMTYHAMNGQLELVEDWTDVRGLSAHEWGEDGATPLMAASDAGAESVVKHLLNHGAVVDWQEFNFGSTALMYAAEAGHTGVVSILLEAGANPNIRTWTGNTALTRALNASHEFTARYLLEHGADPSIDDERGWTPLFYASKANLVDVSQLIFNKTTPSATDLDEALYIHTLRCSFDAVQFYLAKNATADGKNCRKACTPIIAAAACDAVQLLIALHEAGADINLRDSEGFTPFLVAAKFGRIDNLDYLMSEGADVHSFLEDKSKKKKYAWDLATENGHPHVAALLKREILEKKDEL